MSGRLMLRVLLSEYLDCTAGTIRFGYSSHGKPVLGGSTERSLQFNVSHCGGLALYAFSSSHVLGIDLERVRPMPDLEQVAKHAFSISEYTKLMRMPPTERTRAFFRCWTRKEAFVKARGEGLSLPLKDFDVTLGRRAALVATRPDPQEAGRWWLHDLEAGHELAAALAVSGRPTGVNCWARSARVLG